MYGDSKNCANEFYGECEENERICIGRANANFVYAISGKIRNIFPHFTLPYLTFISEYFETKTFESALVTLALKQVSIIM